MSCLTLRMSWSSERIAARHLEHASHRSTRKEADFLPDHAPESQQACCERSSPCSCCSWNGNTVQHCTGKQTSVTSGLCESYDTTTTNTHLCPKGMATQGLKIINKQVTSCVTGTSNGTFERLEYNNSAPHAKICDRNACTSDLQQDHPAKLKPNIASETLKRSFNLKITIPGRLTRSKISV